VGLHRLNDVVEALYFRLANSLQAVRSNVGHTCRRASLSS
jgi:hypothetical protein